MTQEPEVTSGGSVFERPLGSRQRALRWTFYVGAPLLALAVVLLLRPRSKPAAPTGHEAMGAVGVRGSNRA
jgi:hypothetical protein